MLNRGSIPFLGDEDVVEVTCRVSEDGIMPVKQKEIPDAIPVMFILSDGQQQGGVKLNRILPIVKALNSYGIPAEQTGRNDLVVGDRKFSALWKNLNK